MSAPWLEPLPPYPVHAARWAAFCGSVVMRIALIRLEEHDGWQAFERPLPQRLPPLCLPIGKIAPGPNPRRRSRTTQAS